MDAADRVAAVTVIAGEVPKAALDETLVPLDASRTVVVADGDERLAAVFHFACPDEAGWDDVRCRLSKLLDAAGAGGTYSVVADAVRSRTEALRALLFARFMEERGLTRYADIAESGFFPEGAGRRGRRRRLAAQRGAHHFFLRSRHDDKMKQWMKSVFSDYGNKAMSERGIITGFKTDHPPDSLPPLTQLAQYTINGVRNGTLWFEAFFDGEAQATALEQCTAAGQATAGRKVRRGDREARWPSS